MFLLSLANAAQFYLFFVVRRLSNAKIELAAGNEEIFEGYAGASLVQR
jgi:hypothetical protein